MSDRFDLGPLAKAVGRGVRFRSREGAERPDWIALAVLIGVPAVLGAAIGLVGWVPRDTEIVVAAVALLAGALVALFTQLASWRDRLSDTSRAIATRAIDEAVALSLLTSVVAVFAAVLLAVVPNLPVLEEESLRATALEVLERVASGLSVALSANLVLAFVVIVNLLWDAYQNVNRPSPPRWEDD